MGNLAQISSTQDSPIFYQICNNIGYCAPTTTSIIIKVFPSIQINSNRNKYITKSKVPANASTNVVWYPNTSATDHIL